jgi:starch phosphorylase
MRILIDDEDFSWTAAWQIVTNTFFYTNHTVLPVRSRFLHLQLVDQLPFTGSPREMARPNGRARVA